MYSHTRHPTVWYKSNTALTGVYKYFSSAKEVYINTSRALEKCVKILLRRRNDVYKYFLGFSGVGEVLDKYYYIM